MLDLDTRSEARALLAYVADGDDPEATAAQWVGATIPEARAVVREALILAPAERGSEWFADFLSAHRWFRDRGYTSADAALVALAASDLR